MAKETKAFRLGRTAITGEFTTVEEARRHPSTHVVELIPKRGRGVSRK